MLPKDLEALKRSSCAFFAQETLTGAVEPPYNGKFLIGDHHLAWDDLVNNYKRLCVLASRDSGKSHFFSKAYAIWKAKYVPGSTGYIFSESSDQSKDILRKIKEEFEDNPLLQDLVPDTRGVRKTTAWGETRIKLSNGSRIYARSFGTKSRGAHPDWIVVDDGVGDDAGYSEAIRTKQLNFFLSAISNMIVPGGQIIVVGTPQHSQDLYGHLSNNPEYKYVAFPAYRPDGSALWPERYSLESLARKKEEIGSLRFTREFLVRPVSDLMSLFPQTLFKGDPAEQMTARLGLGGKYWIDKGIHTICMGVDFAMSAQTGADYTVIFVMGIDDHQNRWILDIKRGKGMPYQEQLSLINETARLYNVDLVYVESNQMQRIFGDELIRTTDLPIKQYHTGVEKNSMEKGVPSLRILLENRKFRIPRGDKYSVEMTNIWIDEMYSFTWTDGKLQSTGAHDDTVMACIAPGAMITTLHGKRPIEDVKTGDLVLTHLGRWRRVTATMSREYSGRAYVGGGAGRSRFTITDEHPVYRALPSYDRIRNHDSMIVDTDTWDFVEASRIRCGDWLLSPKHTWLNMSTDSSDCVVLENGLGLRVVKWEEITYNGPVHNLQVLDDESYVVEDVAVHNCWICDQACREGTLFSVSFGDGYGAEDPAKLLADLTGEEPKEDDVNGNGNGNGNGSKSDVEKDTQVDNILGEQSPGGPTLGAPSAANIGFYWR